MFFPNVLKLMKPRMEDIVTCPLGSVQIQQKIFSNSLSHSTTLFKLIIMKDADIVNFFFFKTGKKIRLLSLGVDFLTLQRKI